MTKLGIHRRWNRKFLLKEISYRVPEHAKLSSEQLAAYLASDARNEDKIRIYADGDPDSHLSDAVFSMCTHGRLLMRRAQHTIYSHDNPDLSEVLLAAWHDVSRLLIHLGRGAALQGTVPCWGSSIREVAETLACVYALGWNAAADKIAECAVDVMPQGALWMADDWDPRWEKRREPFARFTLALYADFSGITLPALPPHPYESPAYDALLACWRNPDAQALVEPLLAACDWHTHECMYSVGPAKSVCIQRQHP